MICQGAFPNMPQPAEFDGFYYDPASNLLAYHAVTAVICQRSPPPLREVPTLANGIDAESSKSTGTIIFKAQHSTNHNL
jgi:hypothetical protein